MASANSESALDDGTLCSEALVWDLDTTLGLPVTLREYALRALQVGMTEYSGCGNALKAFISL